MASKQPLIEEEEEVLQAVILADSFNKRFRPLTTRKPRVKIAFVVVVTQTFIKLIKNSCAVLTSHLQCTFTRLDF